MASNSVRVDGGGLIFPGKDELSYPDKTKGVVYIYNPRDGPNILLF